MRVRPGIDLPQTSTVVECLACGVLRRATDTPQGTVEAGVCACCGDVGWARPVDLADVERLRLRRSRVRRRDRGVLRGWRSLLQRDAELLG